MWRRVSLSEPPDGLVWVDATDLPELNAVEEMFTDDVNNVSAKSGRDLPTYYQSASKGPDGSFYVEVVLSYDDNRPDESLWYKYTAGNGGSPTSDLFGTGGKTALTIITIGALVIGAGALFLRKR